MFFMFLYLRNMYMILTIVLIIRCAVFLITLCNCIGLIDYMTIFSVLEVQMAVGRVMIFSFTDCTPRFLAVLYVEWEIFCRVVTMLLENVVKTFRLHESNVLSAVFLSTVVFGMSSHRALCAPAILIFEV